MLQDGIHAYPVKKKTVTRGICFNINVTNTKNVDTRTVNLQTKELSFQQLALSRLFEITM